MTSTKTARETLSNNPRFGQTSFHPSVLSSSSSSSPSPPKTISTSSLWPRLYKSRNKSTRYEGQASEQDEDGDDDDDDVVLGGGSVVVDPLVDDLIEQMSLGRPLPPPSPSSHSADTSNRPSHQTKPLSSFSATGSPVDWGPRGGRDASALQYQRQCTSFSCSSGKKMGLESWGLTGSGLGAGSPRSGFSSPFSNITNNNSSSSSSNNSMKAFGSPSANGMGYSPSSSLSLNASPTMTTGRFMFGRRRGEVESPLRGSLSCRESIDRENEDLSRSQFELLPPKFFAPSVRIFFYFFFYFFCIILEGFTYFGLVLGL
jgi:hypothetical protein